MDHLPENWQEFVRGFVTDKEWRLPMEKAEYERISHTVYPPSEQVFRAFAEVAPQDVQVVLLGQDPYHGAGEAEGLSFSVPDGIRIPPSLRNIFKEYSDDLNREVPLHGSLRKWASGGVLLLNAVLTVEADRPGAHAFCGWEKFTDGIISALSSKLSGKVFILWGSYAQKKVPLIDSGKHLIIKSAHPSPLSAYRGFFGSKPFSQAENYLGGSWRWPEL